MTTEMKSLFAGWLPGGMIGVAGWLGILVGRCCQGVTSACPQISETGSWQPASLG